MIEVIEKLDDGIDLISMKNENLEVVVSNFGCTIVKVLMEDKNGNVDDVVLGYDNFEYYKTLDAYLGALVGRIANRIKEGKFSLNGEDYTLAVNNGPNHLHGGIKGFSYQIFDYEIIDDTTIEFHYLSKDKEEGYPGNLDFKAIYQLQDDTLHVHYLATTCLLYTSLLLDFEMLLDEQLKDKEVSIYRLHDIDGDGSKDIDAIYVTKEDGKIVFENHLF